jgi:hypothetical protein
MFKYGICTVDELTRNEGSLTRRYFKKTCYVGLYEDALMVEDTTGRKLQEAILNQFLVSNGAFKRTSKNRMGQFDDTTMETLRELASMRQRCVVHDMAVSDGRTSCDLFAKLSEEFGSALDFYATDVCLKVTALKERGKRTTLVVDDQGNVLQLIFPPFVFRMRKAESWLYPINRIVRLVLMRTSMKRTLNLHRNHDSTVEYRQIFLLCREARSLVTNQSNFRIEAYDVFDKPPRSYSVVRAMNIFNRSYFPDSAIAKAVRNVFESLDEGGAFITGSNGDAGSTVDGAIYVKDRGKFAAVCKSGNGSQVNHIILQTQLS